VRRLRQLRVRRATWIINRIINRIISRIINRIISRVIGQIISRIISRVISRGIGRFIGATSARAGDPDPGIQDRQALATCPDRLR
jgi:hypothetical protein